MSQLPEQILKQSNMNIISPMDHNMNLMNPVPLPQFIPNNQTLPASMAIQDDNKPQNITDTSNSLI
jgi:hypothetical protein